MTPSRSISRVARRLGVLLVLTAALLFGAALVQSPTALAQESGPPISGALTVGTQHNVCADTTEVNVAAGDEVFFCFALTNNSDSDLRWHNLEDDVSGTYFDHYHYRLRAGQRTFFVTNGFAADASFANSARWSSAERRNGNYGESSATANVIVDGVWPPSDDDGKEEEDEGGEDEGEGDGEENAGTANVNVAHFAPFADSLDGTAVDVRVNGDVALENFRFGDIASGVELPAGDYLIEVLPAGTDTVAISGEFSLVEGRYTLAAIGDGANQPLELFPILLDQADGDYEGDNARVLVGHLAPFADTVEGTAVNLCTDDGAAVLENVVYKNTATLDLPAGDYDLKIVPAANGCGDPALDLPSIRLAAGEFVDVFAIGNIANLPLDFATTTGVTPTPMEPGDPATVSIGHFAPFADSVEGTAVDIRVNGEVAFSNFTFPSVERHVELPAGDYLIEVLPAGTDAVAISGDVTLESGMDYTLAAIGDGANQPLELFAQVDDNERVRGKAKILVGHLAPFADTLEGTAVNLCTDDGAAVLENVQYKQTATLELDPGTYDLKVVPAANGCGDAALDLPPLRLRGNRLYDVFAVGNISNLPLTFATTRELERAPQRPARVDVGHFAPFADSVEGTAVDIRVNGEVALEGVVFGDIAKNVRLQPGTYLIEVLPAGTDTVAISGNVTVESDVHYTLAAIGNGTNQALELFPVVEDFERVEGQAKLLVGHLAPFADTLEGTAVNVCTDDGAAVLENVQYKQTAALDLDPGDYDLKVVPAANGCGEAALDLPTVRLRANRFYDLYVIGDIVNLPLTFATTTGLRVIPDRPARVDVGHFAPFANSVEGTAVDIRVNGEVALEGVVFGDVAKNIKLPPGDYLIEVLPAGTDTVAISGNVTVESDVHYTLAAIGNGTNQALELFPVVEDNARVEDKAKILVGHLAPFADTLEGTAVNVCTDDGAAVLENVQYKQTATLELDPGDYDLKVVPAANGCGEAALDLPSVRLRENRVYDLYVIGDIANLPLTFATTTGLRLSPEARPARVSIAHLAPFAETRASTSVSVLLNGEEALSDFQFGDFERNLSIDGGEYLVEVVPTGGNEAAISAMVELEPGVRYFIAAIGDGNFLPLELFVVSYEDGRWVRAAGEGETVVRIAHLAPLAEKLDDTRIDVCTDAGVPVSENIPYRSFITLALPGEEANLMVAAQGTDCAEMILDLPPIELDGAELELFTVGDNVNVPLRSIISDASEPDVDEQIDGAIFLPLVNR